MIGDKHMYSTLFMEGSYTNTTSIASITHDDDGNDPRLTHKQQSVV